MADFDWLSELPDEWKPPGELLEPSKSVEANLAIRMLSCDYLGHEVLVLLGRFIAEHSLFTLWFLKEGKALQRGLKETAILAGLPLEQTRAVYEAWRRFEEISDMQEADAILGERRRAAQEELSSALQAGVETLSLARIANPE
ncbi:hypothetical protein [Micromonospora sp. WMMD980]|uniref:hypothetical protein n=1 Tax=Micromonospora sp. WMMD980 TaxID=3016088 RepID=UPI002416D173|nr:hypothetical protein [Micromonospora sp. WMMD980]MDG4802940.1 hypothetical protein [Micromonospora sp. WMMD980]